MDSSVALIIGALIGAVAGVGGAWLTNRANARSQHEERRHARALERERWEREDRFRWAERRLELYGRFLAAAAVADRMGQAQLAASDQPRLEAAWTELLQIREQIELLSPAMADTTDALLQPSQLFLAMAELRLNGPILPPEPPASGEKWQQEWLAGRRAFVAAASHHLATTDRPES